MQQRLEWLTNNGYIQEDIIKYTKTTRFLMPLIGISEFSLEYIKPKLLINAHCAETDDKIIYVILNKLDFPEEVNDYFILQNLNEHFIDHIEEEEELILIYKVPDHFNDDYIKILNGDYSKTTEAYKQIMLRIYGLHKHDKSYLTTVYDCLYPTEVKRKQIANYFEVNYKDIDEVCSKPNMDYEIFKPLEKLKINYES